MDLGLSGRTALVLGAAGGLGSAIARALAKEGANVALADVESEGLSKLSESVDLCCIDSRNGGLLPSIPPVMIMA